MSGIHIVLRSPSPSPIILQARRRRILAAIPWLILSITIILAVFYAFNHKGYQITRIGPDDYRIEVRLTAQHAAKLTKYMEKNGLESCAARDIRLPNGTFAVARVDLATTRNMLITGAAESTVSTIWRHSDHYTSSLDDTGTLYCLPTKFSYRDITNAIDQAETERTNQALMASDIILPDGRHACCFLSVTELENYRRRMHVVGAKDIIIPFYYSTSGPAAIVSNVPPSPFL